MTNTDLSMDEPSGLRQELLETLRRLGSTSGNISLMRALGWDDERYWEIRDHLVDSGVLVLGRGRGGSVRIVADDDEEELEGNASLIVPMEAELYEPMARVIEHHWAKDQRFERVIVQSTARQGRRDTGGKWTRPDITVAALTTQLYVPGKHFEVVTFEIKAWNGLDVTAVYEALAHARAATRAYVLAHVPDNVLEGKKEDGRTEGVLARIDEEAKRHGIGFITASQPGDYSTWLERVGAEYEPPTPQAMNDLISLQFSETAKHKLLAWYR